VGENGLDHARPAFESGPKAEMFSGILRLPEKAALQSCCFGQGGSAADSLEIKTKPVSAGSSMQQSGRMDKLKSAKSPNRHDRVPQRETCTEGLAT
jgi:hypothetical protein